MHKIGHDEVIAANRQHYDIVAASYFEDEYYAYTPVLKGAVTELLRRGAQLAPQRDMFLDFGCGSGFLSRIVASERLMSAGVGVDASQVQVGLYNRNLQGSGFSATVGDIMKLGLPSGSVDMAGGYSVLHHLFNYYDAIDEITRVLKPGGILYIDFEPNSLFKRLFDLPIRLRRALLDHAKFGNDDLENLAEYHNNFAPGISRKKLLQRLAPNYQILETGSRIPDLAVAPVLRALSKVSFVFSPCFFVLARKAA